MYIHILLGCLARFRVLLPLFLLTIDYVYDIMFFRLQKNVYFEKMRFLDERFDIFSLDPDSIHFQFLSSVNLESPVHQVLSLLQAHLAEEIPHLLLGEEVAPGPVSSHVEVVLYTLPLLEPQLSQVVPAVVSEEQNAPRFEVFDLISRHRLHLAGTDVGQDEDEGDHVQTVRGEDLLPVLGDITDPAVTPALAVLRMVLDQLDGSLS